MICFIVGSGAAFWSTQDQPSLAGSVFSPRSTDHPLWQLGVTSLPCLQLIGDVLSHLELCFARHRALWLRSNKALRHELIINRITQVFELNTCSAAVFISGRGTWCSWDGAHAVSCLGWECLRLSCAQKGHCCQCCQSEFFCCLHLVVRLCLSAAIGVPAARQADLLRGHSGCQHHTPTTSLALSPAFSCLENTQFIIANEQILGPWIARYEQVDLSFNLN